MDKGCKVTKVTTHPRCFCHGKLAKHSRCNLKTHYGTPKRKTAKSKVMGSCITGTIRYRKGGACACKTKGGGHKFVEKSVCKRKYRHKK